MRTGRGIDLEVKRDGEINQTLFYYLKETKMKTNNKKLGLQVYVNETVENKLASIQSELKDKGQDRSISSIIQEFIFDGLRQRGLI